MGILKSISLGHGRIVRREPIGDDSSVIVVCTDDWIEWAIEQRGWIVAESDVDYSSIVSALRDALLFAEFRMVVVDFVGDGEPKLSKATPDVIEHPRGSRKSRKDLARMSDYCTASIRSAF